MQVHQFISDFKDTNKFKDWHAKNKEAKLVHLFIILEPGCAVNYDIGFYDPKNKLMTSFVVDEQFKNIEMSESKEIFAEDDSKIRPLDESKVKIGYLEAFDISHKLQQEKYKQHTPLKEIIILQNLDIGQVWNITYITKSFQTLNIKLDSETGKVLEDKLHQIFSFDK